MNGPSFIRGMAILFALGFALTAQAEESMRQRAMAHFGLDDGWVARFDVDRTPGVEQTVEVEFGDERMTLELSPRKVRSDGYELLIQRADGAVTAGEPANITPVLGTAKATGDRVIGVISDRGLYATVEGDAGQRVWIEPLFQALPDAGPDDHLVYFGSGAVIGGRTCAAEAAVMSGAPSLDGGGGCANGPCVADMVIDADFEYFSTWGDNTEERIFFIVNINNVQFEGDVGITHEISALMIRAAEPDPYNSTDCLTLRAQFRNEWLNNHPEIPRDLAQLFTGKNLDGGVFTCTTAIGAVCTDQAFAVVQSDAFESVQCVTDLHAHELGHMWGASHCSCPGHTMNAGLTCANSFDPEQTVPDIIAYRDSVDCLESSGGPPFIVHGDGLPNETRPFAGYIDPRRESDNGVDPNQGLTGAAILFSEPVEAIGGGPLTTESFVMTETGGGTPPSVIDVNIEAMPLVVVSWDRPLTLQEYTTIQAVVQDSEGEAIINEGNQGPGVDEPDRVDLGFLPGDVNQNEQVTPFDLLSFRQIINEQVEPSPGLVEDYVDTDRNGEITPFDLLAYRQVINGQIPSIQAWQDQVMNNPRP